MGNDHFIKIYNDFMADIDNYNSREQFAYTLLKGLANNINRVTVVSIELMQGVLGLSTHTKNRTAIKELFISMEEKGMILLFEDLLLTKPMSAKNMRTGLSYYAKTLKVGSNGFTKIYSSDLYKFIAIKERYKDLLFTIFFNIIHRIYDSETSDGYSWVTIDTIERETGINRKTIMKYISIMKENEIMYYETVSEASDKDKNYYSRWEGRQRLIDMLHPQDDT